MEKLIIDFEKRVEDNNISNSSVTLRNYIKYYIDNIDKVKNAESTVFTHTAMVKMIPNDVLETRLSELKSSQLQLMYTELSNKYKQNTIKFLHQVLNTILNYAVSDNVIQDNVNKLCAVKGYSNGKKYYLSPEEIIKFLEFLKSSKENG